MDYKKKYDEALERAKGMYEQGMMPERIEYIFPELKESKDEQSKNWILEYLYDVLRKSDEQFKDQFKAAIAWLEKQGEQKTVVIIPKFRVGDVIRPKGSTAEYTIESISGECYHGKGWGLHLSNDDDYELVEQKPAEWSEEDESRMENLCHFLKEYGNQYYGALTLEGTIHWLKSLKDRIQPQLQQEWSEEDKNNIFNIVGALDVLIQREIEKQHNGDRNASPKYYSDLQDWLKSLRPQSQWKPSEEMLEALYRATPKNVMAISEDEMLLDKLYQGLKYGRILS